VCVCVCVCVCVWYFIFVSYCENLISNIDCINKTIAKYIDIKDTASLKWFPQKYHNEIHNDKYSKLSASSQPTTVVSGAMDQRLI
jgi:hypothetical protein